MLLLLDTQCNSHPAKYRNSLKAPESSNTSWRWSNSSSWHTREIISRPSRQPHHRSNNPLRAKPLTVQRINLGCNREDTLSASHNVVLIPADDRSALPVWFYAWEETRPCPCRGRIVSSAWLPLREITDPFRTSSLNLLLSRKSIRRHESLARISNRCTDLGVCLVASLLARVIALVDRQPIGGIGGYQDSFSRD